MDLGQARDVIDEVNDGLVPLIERRMDAVVEVVRYKRERGMAVLDEAREAAVLDKVAARVENPKYAPYVRRMFQAIMDITRDYEQEHMDR